MSIMGRPDLVIAQFDSADWENFVQEYATGLKSSHAYDHVIRLGGSGDGGRDVVAFSTSKGYEGEWDNYQCKFIKHALSDNEILIEIAKIFYHVAEKDFTLPRAIYFAARSHLTRGAQDLIKHPQKLRSTMIERWSAIISKELVAKKEIALEGDLAKLVKENIWPLISFRTKAEMLDVHRTTTYYAERFGGPLPDYKKIPIPQNVTSSEAIYVRKILETYEEKENSSYPDAASIKSNATLNIHFEEQRKLYYEAEAFHRSYVEISPPDSIEEIKNQILAGVRPTERAAYSDSYDCMEKVISHAGTLSPTGLLAPKARIEVKQGICHHLSNENLLNWKK